MLTNCHLDHDDSSIYLKLRLLKAVLLRRKKAQELLEKELLNFKQVCPIEMLDKLDNPITLKSNIKKVS